MTTLDRKAIGQLTEPGIYFDDTLKGFGVRVRTGTDGEPVRSWIVQYRIGKQQRRQKIGDCVKLTDVKARNRATEMLAKVVLGIDPAAEKQTARAASAITLKSVIDQYLEMKELAVQQGNRRASSLRVSRLYLTGKEYFGPLHTTAINAIDKKAIAVRLNAIIINNSANTANRARAHLSAFYTWAMKEGIADANPVIGTNDPEGGKPCERVLKNHELKAIWNACENAGEYGKIVRLLMITGCRRSEIGKLRWSWLDLEHDHTMTIPGAVTKNHRAHTLPITDMMREIIEQIPQRLDRDPLFGERAEGFTGWQLCRLDVTLTEPWTLHDLRRTFSTKMHDDEMKTEPHIVETILNHVSGHKAGVAGNYNYAKYRSQIKKAMGMWCEHIQSIVTGSERKLLNFPTG